jgi:hypothetical protein
MAFTFKLEAWCQWLKGKTPSRIALQRKKRKRKEKHQKKKKIATADS